MPKNTVMLITGILVAMLLVSFMSYLLFYGGQEEGTLLIATTTSTQDSGLLDYILPVFEEEFNCNVSVIALGSGAAMNLGEDGDCDVLLVHSPSAEEDFVENGHGDHRTQVMYNNFVIVGPEGDPIGLAVATNASDAFQMIVDNGTAGNAQFISRADDSGTHNKELSIWATLGYNKTETESFDPDWYIQAQTGMGAVLDMCEQMYDENTYTLSDDATFYARVQNDLIPHLNMTFSGDPMLFNQYSVIAVNATDRPYINRSLALDFVDWITSDDGQDLIASYEKYGHQLFFPNAPGYEVDGSSLVIMMDRTHPRGPSPAIECPKIISRDFSGA